MSIEKLSSNASLKEVMDTFEAIDLKLSNFSDIDIIYASELPPNGREGQLCVITSVNPSKCILSKFKPSKMNESEIYICIDGIKSQKIFYYKSKNTEVRFHLLDITQKINGLEKKLNSYIYTNSTWVKVTSAMLLAYQSGKFYNTDILGGEELTCIEGTGDVIEYNEDHIGVYVVTTYGHVNYKFPNKIDLTLYSKLYATISSLDCDNNRCFKLGVYRNNSSQFKVETSTGSEGTISVNISNLTGLHDVGFLVSYGSQSATYAEITKIWFE
jgi:hypothetical protein